MSAVRILFPALGLALLAACEHGAAEPPAEAPALVQLLDPAEGIGPVPDAPPRANYHDFGHVPDGETVHHVFRYRNVRERPIAIERVIPSCGCAIAAIRAVAPDGSATLGESITSEKTPLLVVPPGATFELDLKIDTREVSQKNLDRLYTIRVSTDAEGSFYLSLEAHLYIELAFEIAPQVLNLGRIAESVGGSRPVDVAQGPGYAYEVRAVLEESPGLATTIEPSEAGGRKVWRIEGALAPPLERGPYRGLLRLATADGAGNAGPTLSIPVVAEIVPDIECAPARLVFSAQRTEATAVSANLRSLVPGHRLRLRGARVDPAHGAWLKASFAPIEPDGEGRSSEWSLSLATVPPLPQQELLRGELVLETDDAAYPEVAVPYVVHLR